MTVILPYILLAVILIRGLMLDGSTDGILFYIKPDFSKLFNFQVCNNVQFKRKHIHEANCVYSALVRGSSHWARLMISMKPSTYIVKFILNHLDQGFSPLGRANIVIKFKCMLFFTIFSLVLSQSWEVN